MHRPHAQAQKRGNYLQPPTSGNTLALESEFHGHRACACSGERIRPWLPRQEQVPHAKLPEEQQIRIAQRISLIQHLLKGVYDHGGDGADDKIQECVICWMDFVHRDPI